MLNVCMNDPVLTVAPRRTIGLKDAAGTIVRVLRGSVWITLEHDRRDVVVEAGQSWMIDRDGLTLVHAERPARVVLRERRSTRECAPPEGSARGETAGSRVETGADAVGTRGDSASRGRWRWLHDAAHYFRRAARRRVTVPYY